MEFLCVQKRSARNSRYGEFNALAPDRKIATAKHLKVMVEQQDIDNAAFKRDLIQVIDYAIRKLGEQR